MSEATPDAAPNGRALQMMPVSLFASVMGLAGLGLVWGKAAEVLNTGTWIADVLIVLSAAVYVLLGAAFVLKWIRYPQAVAAE